MPWLAFLIALSFAGQAPAWQPRLDAAHALLVAGLNAESVKAYEAALETHPGLPQARIGLARALAALASESKDEPGSARFRRAEAELLRAIDDATTDPVRREALFTLAETFAFWQPTRRHDARLVFDGIVARRPDDVDAHLARAKASAAIDAIAAYAADLRAVRARFPKSSEVRWTFAMALRDQANLTAQGNAARQRPLLAEAIAEFDAALQMDSQSGMAVMYKSLTLRDLADIESDPAKAETLRAEAKVLFARGEELLKRAGKH